MHETRRIAVQGVIFGLVILTGMLFAATVYSKGQVMEAGIAFLVAVLFGAFAVKFLKDQDENARKGIPREDERSQRIKQKAGYTAFLVSIYLLLAIGYYSEMTLEDPSLPAIRDISQATSMAIAGIALTFGICWWYFNGKGDA